MPKLVSSVKGNRLNAICSSPRVPITGYGKCTTKAQNHNRSWTCDSVLRRECIRGRIQSEMRTSGAGRGCQVSKQKRLVEQSKAWACMDGVNDSLSNDVVELENGVDQPAPV